MNKKYLTITETADMLGVCERTVRRRIADQTLHARRFGPKLLRIEAASIDRLMGVAAA